MGFTKKRKAVQTPWRVARLERAGGLPVASRDQLADGVLVAASAAARVAVFFAAAFLAGALAAGLAAAFAGAAFFATAFLAGALAAGLAGGFGDLFFGHGLGLALDGQAFLDQGLKHLAAFFLCLGEGTQACQPDLLGGVLDGAGQLGVALFLVSAEFLQFLDHGASVVRLVGCAGAGCLRRMVKKLQKLSADKKKSNAQLS